jgi:sirohydrochlorin ferrochelatase
MRLHNTHDSAEAGTPSRLRSLASTAALAIAATAGLAETSAAQSKPVGLMVVAHGADSIWNSRVRQTVAQMKWTHGPVKVAYLMGSEAKTASWDSAATQLQREGVGSVVIVPFMVSSYGGHTRQIQFYAGKIPSLPPELGAMMEAMGGGHDHHALVKLTVPSVVTSALDDAPELGEALIGRWNDLPAADKKRPVMLIAHGPNNPEDVIHWETNILKTAKALREAVAPRPVRVSLLRDDAPPEVRAAAVAAMRDTIVSLGKVAKDSVTVLPVLISTGDVNNVKIPADINGLPVRYAPVGLAPHAAMAKWIVRIADEARAQLKTSADIKQHD